MLNVACCFHELFIVIYLTEQKNGLNNQAKEKEGKPKEGTGKRETYKPTTNETSGRSDNEQTKEKAGNNRNE